MLKDNRWVVGLGMYSWSKRRNLTATFKFPAFLYSSRKPSEIIVISLMRPVSARTFLIRSMPSISGNAKVSKHEGGFMAEHESESLGCPKAYGFVPDPKCASKTTR